MGQPISEQILDNIVTTITNLSVVDASDTLTPVVRRESDPWEDLNNYPSADVWLISEAKTSGENMGHRDCTMTVEIRAYADTVDDVDQYLSYLAADIEKALMVDDTRGSLAITTEITSHEHIFADDQAPGSITGMVSIELEIWYRHRIADPYTT